MDIRYLKPEVEDQEQEQDDSKVIIYCPCCDEPIGVVDLDENQQQEPQE